MTEQEIKEICQQYYIENYKINPDTSIDVFQEVYLFNKKLTNLPLKFGKITGHFTCRDNELTSLEGCPHYVSGDFICDANKLTTLKYCPEHVEGGFYCYNNILTSLSDLPMNFYIGGSFYCYNNNITETKEYSRLFFGHIGGHISTGNESLSDFLNKNKNPPKKDLPRLLSELRKIKL